MPTLLLAPPIHERFVSKFIEMGDDDHWLWTDLPAPSGYGHFGVAKGDVRPAHRVSYEIFRGLIPAALEIDHLCRVRLCVNPWHLEPVTTRENLLRSSLTLAGINAAKTECIHGHSLTGENLHISPQGWRVCKICRTHNRRVGRARRAHS